MWGAGVTLYSIFTGLSLWKRADDGDDMFAAWCDAYAYRNRQGLREILAGDLHDECFDLLVRMLDPCPETRITLAKACEHTWLA